MLGAAVVLGCALALGLAPSAQATTNLVPNPSFESNCGGVPCNWSNESGATVVRDTSTGLASPASMKVTLTGSFAISGGQSTCVNQPVSGGAHDATFWYLTSSASVLEVRMVVGFHSGASCTGVLTGATSFFPATADGTWHGLEFPVTAPASASVSFHLEVKTTLGQTPAVNFDMADFEQEVLAVALASFRAGRSRNGVVVRWRTGTEVDELGFNLYRQQGNRRVRVNRHLLPAIGALAGATYSFTDRRAPRHRALRYWLQDVELNGTRAWHGPVRVAAS